MVTGGKFRMGRKKVTVRGLSLTHLHGLHHWLCCSRPYLARHFFILTEEESSNYNPEVIKSIKATRTATTTIILNKTHKERIQSHSGASPTMIFLRNCLVCLKISREGRNTDKNWISHLNLNVFIFLYYVNNKPGSQINYTLKFIHH